MKNAGQADEIIQDQTTMYVINNLSKLEYGVVDIVNLFPSIEGDETKESSIENLKCIQEAVARVDDVIIESEKVQRQTRKLLKVKHDFSFVTR
ncbi:DUF1643 domain-containing protein [Bacillus subtilis]|nr:DUF1643 domain-containing protein [Bacillus subtilis]